MRILVSDTSSFDSVYIEFHDDEFTNERHAVWLRAPEARELIKQLQDNLSPE